MAKSKIIRDLANGEVDTVVALKRAKVLFYELDNEKLQEWVNCEISGYSSESELPDYRIIEGNLIGSYFKGSMASHMKWNNVSIPFGKMPDDIKHDILSVCLYDGVDALKHLIQFNENSENRLGKQLPADIFPIFNKYNNDPYMIITSARVEIGTHCISNIISVVENRLLDALIILEKEFGNLDELDISISKKTPIEIDEIANKINVLIYNDNSITIGNDNKIKDSRFDQQQ